MSFFDENGKLNQAFAQQVYNQAGGQVTGQLPAGVPILGAGIEFKDVAKAPWGAVDECIEHIKQPLEAGAPPEAPVMVALLQFAQIMKLLDSLRPQVVEVEEDTDGENEPQTNLGIIFAALGEAIAHIRRQSLHGKHEQDRIDAAEWLEKYEKHAKFLSSKNENEFRLQLDPNREVKE